MYRESDAYAGTPARVYRSLGEIRRDICYIRGEIKEAGESLNMRALLLDFLDRLRDSEPCEWLPELEAAVAEAREAYDSLRELNEELVCLREELGDTRCAMGV